MTLMSGTASHNGRAPKAGSTTHVSATSTKPSRGCSSRRNRRVARLARMPATSVTAIEIRKASSAASWRAIAKASGTIMSSANSTSMRPTRATTASGEFIV